MRMIPDTPHGSQSKAEKRIFDKLRALAFNEDQGVYTAYHSLNLTEHQYKRFGEIDFLITGPVGIFVLEVKGGRVACKEGVWEFTNKHGRVARKVEGPFKQAETALHGLVSKLRKNLTDYLVDQFYIGFGVITPDQQWNEIGAEWAPHTLADARVCNDIDGWLRKLFRYWKEKDGRNRQVKRDQLEVLNRYLRPNFETITPLYVLTSDVKERVDTLTEDQMVMVDVVYANQRVLCSGGAGTGKTYVAMELARRWAARDLKVILACKSPWLKNYLEVKFATPNLTVTLVDGAKIAMRRAGVDYFDALIVDEGQDMFDMESLDTIGSVLKGGLEAGRWCFFHDMNNQARLFGKFEDEAFEYLSLLKTAEVPLRTNCRNTKVILEKVQKALGADMGARGAGMGPDIRENVGDKQESARILEKEIEDIVEQGGLAPGSLTILSPKGFDESCVSLLPKRIREKIALLDEYAARSFPIKQMSFASIAGFKGLENEAIIVVDLAKPEETDDLAAHYVGMSRPRAILSLIYLS